MGRVFQDRQVARLRNQTGSFFPIDVKGIDRQALAFADFDIFTAKKTEGELALSEPIGRLARIPRHRWIHLAKNFFEKSRTQLRVVIPKKHVAVSRSRG